MKNARLFLLLIVALAMMILVACGGTTTTETPAEEAAATEAPAEEPAAPAAEVSGKVGIVLPTKDEPRWVQDETRFRAALEEAGYEVEILFSQGDSAKERANVEDLVTKGMQVLIITPQDGTAAAAAAEAARDAGVKVISYDRLIRDTDAVDYYVTFDSIAVGAQQACLGQETQVHLAAFHVRQAAVAAIERVQLDTVADRRAVVVGLERERVVVLEQEAAGEGAVQGRALTPRAQHEPR